MSETEAHDKKSEGNGISIFIDHSCSDEEDTMDKLSSFVPRNILAFDDAVLEMDEEDYDSDYGNENIDEDSQSRSSSTDLNNFLQIKQVLCE